MNDFTLTDSDTSRRVITALNISFDSLADVINEYKPNFTNQDYAVLTYFGPIKAGMSIITEIPAIEATPIYCQYGSEMVYIGKLEGTLLSVERDLKDGSDNEIDLNIYQPYRR